MLANDPAVERFIAAYLTGETPILMRPPADMPDAPLFLAYELGNSELVAIEAIVDDDSGRLFVDIGIRWSDFEVSQGGERGNRENLDLPVSSDDANDPPPRETARGGDATRRAYFVNCRAHLYHRETALHRPTLGQFCLECGRNYEIETDLFSGNQTTSEDASRA